jgi:nucleoside-diphosphate-sugar epimerase
LVEFLADKNLVSKIRVADKVLPDLGCLSKKQQALFKSDLVDFKQVNLAREPMVELKVFEEADGKWDFVINLAGETKLSQTDEVYKENIIEVSVVCAKVAAKHNVKRFIEVSTSQVYDAGKKPSSESDKIKPWTKLAKAKFDAEEQLRAIKGIQILFVRPAIVYGPGDITGITPRIICGAVYKQLGEKMEFLWDKELRINTVHVRDVVAALWHLTSAGEPGGVYNLADSGETDQGEVAKILENIFKIKSGFMGSIQSKLVTAVAMKTVAETANEKHLKPWSDLCKAKNILNTPLTPYLDEELLYNNSLSIDGTGITKTGFEYRHPKVTEELIREVIQYFVDLDIFPKGFI